MVGERFCLSDQLPLARLSTNGTASPRDVVKVPDTSVSSDWFVTYVAGLNQAEPKA